MRALPLALLLLSACTGDDNSTSEPSTSTTGESTSTGGETTISETTTGGDLCAAAVYGCLFVPNANGCKDCGSDCPAGGEGAALCTTVIGGCPEAMSYCNCLHDLCVVGGSFVAETCAVCVVECGDAPIAVDCKEPPP